MGAADRDPFLDAVQGMQELKAEHRALIGQIAADPGMAPETRRALLEHVLDEEDEKLAQIAHVAREPQASPRAPEASGAAPLRTAGRTRLSVGTLRAVDDRPPPPRGTIGSLRND